MEKGDILCWRASRCLNTLKLNNKTELKAVAETAPFPLLRQVLENPGKKIFPSYLL